MQIIYKEINNNLTEIENTDTVTAVDLMLTYNSLGSTEQPIYINSQDKVIDIESFEGWAMAIVRGARIGYRIL